MNMLYTFFTSLRRDRRSKEDNSSEFSKFFRKASSREKKRVFMDVARKASEEQRKVLQETS